MVVFCCFQRYGEPSGDLNHRTVQFFNCFNGFVSNTGKHVREKEKPARPPYYFFSPCYNRRSIKQIASSLLNFEKGE